MGSALKPHLSHFISIFFSIFLYSLFVIKSCLPVARDTCQWVALYFFLLGGGSGNLPSTGRSVLL